MTQPDLTLLTKKLKLARKKIRQLGEELDSEREARAALEKKVSDISRVQNTLMHNLRRVFKKMDMKPEIKR